MKIIFFSNPSFFANKKVQGFTSMPRYVNMLAAGMKARGHQVEIWTPKPLFFNLPITRFKKWLGYIDQYIIFPKKVNKQLKRSAEKTLFVYTDQAQGPWVPLAVNNPHVIHCHDFLSQQSMTELSHQNPLSYTGRLYQNYIRKGLSRGNNFISVSQKTKSDLERIGIQRIDSSEVVYNGVSECFRQTNADEARKIVGEMCGRDLTAGYILNVGSNLWYKNRAGVIEIYEKWLTLTDKALPLIMIGEDFSNAVKNMIAANKGLEVIRLSNVTDEQMQKIYSGATVMLFPSFAEGFGWPIAEALSSGCPVITTNKAPMTEVGGGFSTFIEAKHLPNEPDAAWAMEGGKAIERVVKLNPADRAELISKGFDHSKQFRKDMVIEKVEKIYFEIIRNHAN